MTAFTRLLPLLALLVLTACSKPKSPEQRVRETLARIEEAAEAKDLGALKEMLAASYHDSKGNDKKGLVSMLQLRFLRGGSLHVLTDIESITLAGDDRADVVLLAAMASVPLPDADALARLRADTFRIELGLVRDGDDWQVEKARWTRAGLADWL